jgi:hypothetical protein
MFLCMKHKTQVDTPYENSWADQEFKRTHKAITQFNVWTGEREIVEWERIYLPTPEWHGSPSVLIPNLVSLGPIDHKWARIFNG